MSVLYHTGTHLVGITLHVSFPVPNHTPHNQEIVMPRARLYKGELASPSRYTYELDRRSASVPACTLRSTAEDVLPPRWKQLPIIGALYTTVATQSFSSDRSFGARRRVSFAKLPRSNNLPP